jgi:hypothetical protein
LFVVNFKVRTSNEKFLIVIVWVIKVAEYMIKSIWNNTFLRLISFQSNHSMSFTASCLSVGKDRSIIPKHNWFNQRKSTFIINTSLSRILIIYCVKCEGSFCFALISLIYNGLHYYLVYRFIDFNATFRASLQFFLTHWSASHHNLYTFIFVRSFRHSLLLL